MITSASDSIECIPSGPAPPTPPTPAIPFTISGQGIGFNTYICDGISEDGSVFITISAQGQEDGTVTGSVNIDLHAFSTPYKGDLMRFTVNAVNIPPSLQQNLTLDKLVDLNLNSLKQQLSNFTLFESNQTTISSNENQTAHKIVYTNTNKNPNFPLTFKSMQIFTIRDGQAYTISYVSEDSQYMRHLPIIERMIDSIRFTQS